MRRKIAAALAIGALLGGLLAVVADRAVAAPVTLGVCNPGWYANEDEDKRLPTPGPAGLKFEGNDLIHHAANVAVADLEPGTYTASPAPDQPSFFSVEVRGPSGAYATLRWSSTGPLVGKWTVVIGAGNGATEGTFSDADPALLLTGKVTKWGAFSPTTAKVVSFGVGYTNDPPGTVATVVTSVKFQGKDYDLKCAPPASSSGSPSASASGTVRPSGSAVATLPITGTSALPYVAASGGVMLLAGVALLVWLARRNRNRTRFEA